MRSYQVLKQCWVKRWNLLISTVLGIANVWYLTPFEKSIFWFSKSKIWSGIMWACLFFYSLFNFQNGLLPHCVKKKKDKRKIFEFYKSSSTLLTETNFTLRLQMDIIMLTLKILVYFVSFPFLLVLRYQQIFFHFIFSSLLDFEVLVNVKLFIACMWYLICFSETAPLKQSLIGKKNRISLPQLLSRFPCLN